MPAMLDAVAAGKISLHKAMALLSGNAAARFNLPGKGRIAIGADADVILVDLEAKTMISPDTLLTFARDVAQLYYGAEFTGRVLRTIVSGNIVYDGTIAGHAGWGKYVSPANSQIHANTRLSV